jgi:hypothetical protein
LSRRAKAGAFAPIGRRTWDFLAATLSGKLPRKGKPMTVRVVRADTAEVVAAKRLSKPKYKLKVAAGPYLVLGGAGKKQLKSRMVRVRKRGTKAVALRAASPVLATVAVSPIDIDGMPIDGPLISEMFAVDCANGGRVRFVEVRHRDLIEREIKLQQGPGFDASTRVKPNFAKPDTFITGTGEISGGMVTIELTMTGTVTGSSSVSVPVSRFFDTFATLGSDLMGQICEPADEPPPPPAVDRSVYTGSLSGSAVIPSPAGTITETWSAPSVRFTRTDRSSPGAPNYEITSGTAQISVSGTVGACTVAGSTSASLVADDASDNTLDFAPDDSYYAVAYSSETFDVTYSCPDGSGPGSYTFMTEVLRTNPDFVRRMPAADGSIGGSVGMARDGKQLSFTWSFAPRG